MARELEVEKSLVRLGIGAGVAASVMYPARTFLDLPEFLSMAFFILFGPVLVVAFVGLYPFLKRPRESAAALLGSVFGVLAGVVNMAFAVVQINNLYYIRNYLRAATTAAERESWDRILDGVFTVQNGLNYVADFFVDWTAILWAIVLWGHPKGGRTIAVLGMLAGGLHFGMKLVAFPVPPAEAGLGLFDAGPFVSVWFTIVTLQVIRHRRWMEAW